MVPFRLTNAPTVFMFLNNNVLRRYLDKFFIVFVDDILVYSMAEENNKKHLTTMLQLLREHKLYVNIRKYDLFQSHIHYLGNIISNEGISVDLEKIKAIIEWMTPNNLNEVCWVV